MTHESAIRLMYFDLLKRDKYFLESEVKLQKFMDCLNFDKFKPDISPIKTGDTVTYDLPERYRQ
jgi:hypothetical protein